MADEAKGAGGLPSAIERSRLLKLPVSGEMIEVRRWSYARLMQVSAFLTEGYDGIAEDDLDGALKAFYAHGHGRFLEVAKLSVAPEQRDKINEDMDASDVLAVMQAAFEINSGDNLKKAAHLAGQFLLGHMGRPQKGGETKQEPPKAEKDKPTEVLKKS